MPHVKWYEPASFVKSHGRKLYGAPPPWIKPALLLGISLGLFGMIRAGVWFRGQEHPQFGFWSGLALAVGIGALFAYGLPTLVGLSTAEIWTDDRGLHRKTLAGPDRVNVETWPWDVLDSYRFETMDLEGRRYDVIAFRTRTMRTFWIGLDGKVLENQVEGVLTARGLSRIPWDARPGGSA